VLPAVVLAATLAACGGGGGSAPAAGPPTEPDLDAFLRLPVATPASCPPDVNGTTSGRRSPWVGHVDVSVFLDDLDRRATHRLGAALDRIPQVRRVYYESAAQAYAEFQRLYTCSEQVPASAVPASYRLLLYAVTRPERDDVVRRIYDLPGVAGVSCDPSSPCVDLRPGGS
jgi:hypothetical protein